MDDEDEDELLTVLDEDLDEDDLLFELADDLLVEELADLLYVGREELLYAFLEVEGVLLRTTLRCPLDEFTGFT